jgi:hypothetical protein
MSAQRRSLLLITAVVCAAGALAAESEGVPARNPFTRPAYMIAALAPTAAPVAIPELRLRATLIGSGAPLANIDGEILTIGQTHAGYRLARIQEGRVVLLKDGERTLLEVYEVPTASPRRR